MAEAPATLSELIEALRQIGDFSAPQSLGADRATVTRLWAESADPFAMLLLLATLSPRRHVALCDALARSMSFFPPMQREVVWLSRWRPGMHYNGRDHWNFLYQAQLLRGALRSMTAEERAELEPLLSEAIRGVVDDPFAVAEV